MTRTSTRSTTPTSSSTGSGTPASRPTWTSTGARQRPRGRPQVRPSSSPRLGRATRSPTRPWSRRPTPHFTPRTLRLTTASTSRKRLNWSHKITYFQCEMQFHFHAFIINFSTYNIVYRYLVRELSSPGPKPFSPKPKTKGPWADTKLLQANFNHFHHFFSFIFHTFV